MRRAFASTLGRLEVHQQPFARHRISSSIMHGTAVPVPVHTKTPTMMLAGPTFSRSQSHYSQGTVSEYVEDSEPEREERRVRQKSSSTQPRINHRVKLDPEVIELSDSEESACAGLSTASVLKPKERPCIIINVSGMSSSSATT
ncbi:hypothetical protein BN946_scf184470.g11 [Trametes cinnabarina]|uniref:Uncharacterized protein n=1 Tax=Pycnoporus cinnabarinus TaxID=5643 RepID=A0A060SUW1_PYCCI|nr:hypothetical protein BN946_scf184470.g11 [Trametes cinnabarina]